MADIEIHAKFSIEFFPDRINRVLDSPDGPVGRHLNGVAKNIHQVSRGLIGPKGYSGTTGKPKEARPGPLRDSGSVVNIGGAAWSVVYNHPIAFIHHNGSMPHAIPDGGKPNKTIKGRQRVFLYNEKLPWGPRYSAVSHPGTKANPYLTRAAAQLGLRSSGSLMRGRTLTPLFRSSNFF